MSNIIYYIEWKGKYSGKDYRLEVFGAGTAFSTIEYVKIDKHCIDIKNFEWQFKDIPFGTNSNTNIEIKWHLKYINNSTLFERLRSPILIYQLPTTNGNVPFETGNVYVLKIDNVVVYRGVQLSDEDYGFDGSDVYTVELTGLAKHLTTCFSFKRFIELTSADYALKTQDSTIIYEYYDRHMFNSWRCIGNVTSQSDEESFKNKYRFWRLSSFETWLKTALQTCAAMILRQSSVTLNFEIPFITYYKQDNQGNQTLGAILSKSEIYLLTYIVVKGKLVGGLFAPTADSMGSRYATIYDLLSDWSQSEGMKMFLSPNGLDIMPYPIFGKNPTTVIPESKTIELKSVKKIRRKQVTISLEEFSDKDIDNYRYNDGVPRNNEEIQLPLIWNVTPPVNGYTKKKIGIDYVKSAGFDIMSTFGDLYVSWNPVRVWNYYYFDRPLGLVVDCAFRVHDFCRSDTRIRGGSANEAMGTEPSIMSVDFDDVNKADAYCLAVQSEHSKASMFKRFNIYFGMYGACRVTAKIPLVNFTFAALFNGANNVVSFNLAEFNSIMQWYPTEFYITKISFDIENEEFDVEMIGIGV